MWALFGIVLSAAWLGAVYWWFREYYGLENITYMLPGEVGQALAGVMAPLALIWILIAYVRNGASLHRIGEELVDLREALRQRPVSRPDAPRGNHLGRTPAGTPGDGPATAPGAPVAPAQMPPPAAPAAPPPAAPAPPVPLSLGDSPDTAMLPSPALPPGFKAEREPGKPQPGPDAAAPGVPPELDPELQQQLYRVARDLNAISMDLAAVLCTKAARDEALKVYNRGQKDAFHQLVRDYLAQHAPAETLSRLAQADATGLLHAYATKFAGLLEEAKRHDSSGGQEELLRRSALGQLYDEVSRHTSSAQGPLRG